MLSLVSLFFWLDGHVLSILIQPIEADLKLTDSQLGLLSGFAYSALSLVATVPLATLGDRKSHSWVLCGCLAMWSTMTVASGAATGFVSLFLCRMGVGAGQAGGIPSIHALISTRLPRYIQARAFSLIGTTSYLGAILGVSLGGVISDRWGWRWALWLAGAPGLVLALAVPLTFRAQPSSSHGASAVSAGMPIMTAARWLFAKPTYRWIVFGSVLTFVGAYGNQAWMPTFLIRAFDLSRTRAGFLFGACWGIVGALGTLAGGALVDWWARRDARAFVWALVLGYTLPIPFFLISYGATDLTVALMALAAAAFTFSLQLGPLYAVVQKLAPHSMRATSAALVVLICGTAGMTVGPLAVGMLTQSLQAQGPGTAIRMSMTTMLTTFVCGALCYWRASRTAVSDFHAAEIEM